MESLFGEEVLLTKTYDLVIKENDNGKEKVKKFIGALKGAYGGWKNGDEHNNKLLDIVERGGDTTKKIYIGPFMTGGGEAAIYSLTYDNVTYDNVENPTQIVPDVVLRVQKDEDTDEIRDGQFGTDTTTSNIFCKMIAMQTFYGGQIQIQEKMDMTVEQCYDKIDELPQSEKLKEFEIFTSSLFSFLCYFVDCIFENGMYMIDLGPNNVMCKRINGTYVFRTIDVGSIKKITGAPIIHILPYYFISAMRQLLDARRYAKGLNSTDLERLNCILFTLFGAKQCFIEGATVDKMKDRSPNIVNAWQKGIDYAIQEMTKKYSITNAIFGIKETMLTIPNNDFIVGNVIQIGNTKHTIQEKTGNDIIVDKVEKSNIIIDEENEENTKAQLVDRPNLNIWDILELCRKGVGITKSMYETKTPYESPQRPKRRRTTSTYIDTPAFRVLSFN